MLPTYDQFLPNFTIIVVTGTELTEHKKDKDEYEKRRQVRDEGQMGRF